MNVSLLRATAFMASFRVDEPWGWLILLAAAVLFGAVIWGPKLWMRVASQTKEGDRHCGAEQADPADAVEQAQPDDDIRQVILRAIAPDNLDPRASERLFSLGPEAVPTLVELFEHPGRFGSVAPDQRLLALALASHAENGNNHAASFLRRIAAGDLQLYDFGGQQAFGIATDFVRETDRVKRSTNGQTDVQNSTHHDNATRPKRASSLHEAAESGDIAAVRKFLSQGAGVNGPDPNGSTPLILAAAEGHAEVLAALLEKDPRQGMADPQGMIPLHYACQNGHLAAVQALLSAGCEVNRLMRDGRTPLHFAAANGHMDIVRVLVEHDANVKSCRHVPGRFYVPGPGEINGLTASALADRNGHKELAAFLREKEGASRPKKQGGACAMATKDEVKARWRQLAQEWWESSGRTSCYCDDNRCLVDGENQMQSKALQRGEGYVHHLTKRIYCEECADRRLGEEWSSLESQPI